MQGKLSWRRLITLITDVGADTSPIQECLVIAINYVDMSLAEGLILSLQKGASLIHKTRH